MTPAFPAEYAADFVRMCANRSDVRLINYHDLLWAADDDPTKHYPKEYVRSRAGRPSDKIDVLIQYDVDADVQRTVDLLALHETLEASASVMVFSIPLLPQGYHGPLSKYKSMFSRERFAIGYHSNSYELADHDLEEMKKEFVMDVGMLADLYGSIRYFSPHGGKRDAEGLTNVHVLADLIAKEPDFFGPMLWVHNKYGPKFDLVYSDGGLGSKAYNVERDLRVFVDRWKPGNRYRILLHPQYYGEGHAPLKRLEGVAWYEDVLQTYAKGRRAWAR